MERSNFKHLIFAFFLALAIVSKNSTNRVRADALSTNNIDDRAGLLTPNARKHIESINSDKLSSVIGYPQIAVLTVDSIGDNNIAKYAQEQFDKYKLGNTSENNGVLIVVAKKQGKIRVQTGYGMESILPDIYLYSLIDKVFNKHQTSNNDTSSSIDGNGGKSGGGGADKNISVVEDTTSDSIVKLVEKIACRIKAKSSSTKHNNNDNKQTMLNSIEHTRKLALAMVILTPLGILAGMSFGKICAVRKVRSINAAYTNIYQNKKRHVAWEQFNLKLKDYGVHNSYYEYYIHFYKKYDKAPKSMLLDAIVWDLIKKKQDVNKTAKENDREMTVFLNAINYKLGIKPEIEKLSKNELKTVIYELRKQDKEYIRKWHLKPKN